MAFMVARMLGHVPYWLIALPFVLIALTFFYSGVYAAREIERRERGG
jgi:hypothetical protein